MKNNHSEADLVCTYVVSKNDAGQDVECGKAFTTQTRLKNHVAMHEAKEERKCDYCFQTFRKMETLQRHIKKEHLKENEVYRCDIIVPRDPEKLLDEDMIDIQDGEECGETFASSARLRTHQNSAHKMKKFYCSICPMHDTNGNPYEGVGSPPGVNDGIVDETVQWVDPPHFPSYNELLAHIREAHPPKCATCGLMCDSNSSLTAHIDIHHGTIEDRKVHACTWPGCDRSFTRRGNMLMHVRDIHEQTKKFICGEYDLSKSTKLEDWDGEGCGMVLTTKASLESHIRSAHLGIHQSRRNLRANRKQKKKVTFEDDDVDDLMPGLDINTATPTDSASSVPTPGDSDALAMLTGVGYEDNRHLACWMADEGCGRRFKRECDLGRHMEAAHGWNEDQINHMFALQAEGDIEGDEMLVDEGLALNDGAGEVFAGDGAIGDMHGGPYWHGMNQYEVPKTGYAEAPLEAGLDEMFGEEAMALDPALMEL